MWQSKVSVIFTIKTKFLHPDISMLTVGDPCKSISSILMQSLFAVIYFVPVQNLCETQTPEQISIEPTSDSTYRRWSCHDVHILILHRLIFFIFCVTKKHEGVTFRKTISLNMYWYLLKFFYLCIVHFLMLMYI